MKGSKLNRRIGIQAPNNTADGSAGERVGWVLVASNVPANITYPPPSKRGDEVFTQQQVRSALFVAVQIRYRPSLNIDASMQVVYGSRIFNIRTVQNVDEARKYILLQCEELQSTGSMH